MTRNEMIIGVTVLLVILSTSILGIWTTRDIPMDCSDHATEMSAWITDCSGKPWQNTASCTVEARKIFCKPVCTK